jgi:hypothetical protein
VTTMPTGFENPQPVISDEHGTTYRAWQQDPGRDVAVRILDLTVPGRPSRRQFRNSCLAAADLAGDPGVLDLFEVDFTSDQHPYLVTEFPHGLLAQRLAVHGPAPVRYTAQAGIALSQTLLTAHGRGVLHLDVRPENVVHTESAGPLLANFGVTRAVTAMGQVELPAGSLVHAAGELFGRQSAGPAADVYGLGSTLYMMLAGQAAYAADARLGREALYQRVLRGGLPPIPRGDIPRRFAVLLIDMMSPDPVNRPVMGAVSEELAACAAEALPLAPPMGPLQAPRLPAGLAGALAAAGGPGAPAGMTPAAGLPAQPPAPLPLAPPPTARNDTNPFQTSLERRQNDFGAVESLATGAPGEPSALAQGLNPPPPGTPDAYQAPPAHAMNQAPYAQDLSQAPPAHAMNQAPYAQDLSQAPPAHASPPLGGHGLGQSPVGTQVSAWPGSATGPLARQRRDTQPQPVQPPAKHRRIGQILLLSLGVVALLGGVAWGAITAPGSVQGTPGPKITQTSAASLLPAAQQVAYRAGGVKVTARARGARVSWTAPHSSKGVTAFIVVAGLASQAKQEHTVGVHSRSVAFAGLRAGQRYCFVVGTLVKSADGRSNTAATRPVCTVVPASA